MSRRLSRYSAVCAARSLISLRDPRNTTRFASVPLGDATPNQTVPTGFSGVPPDGPAIPVTEIERSTPSRTRVPSAIARATSSLTAPCRAISSGAHVQEPGLELVGVADHAPDEDLRAARDLGEPAPDQPAGAGLSRPDCEPRAPGALQDHRGKIDIRLAIDVLTGPDGEQVGRGPEAAIRIAGSSPHAVIRRSTPSMPGR